MKIFIVFVFAAIFTSISIFFNISIKGDIISTIYNTIGIVFSIGMGLIVTFSISEVKNESYILSIRKNIKQIRRKFITLFSLCTILFIGYRYIPMHYFFKINTSQLSSNFTLMFFLISIIYFILNFIRLQNLKDDIFDRVLQEKKH